MVCPLSRDHRERLGPLKQLAAIVMSFDYKPNFNAEIPVSIFMQLAKPDPNLTDPYHMPRLDALTLESSRTSQKPI